jgi:hypothetical protein
LLFHKPIKITTLFLLQLPISIQFARNQDIKIKIKSSSMFTGKSDMPTNQTRRGTNSVLKKIGSAPNKVFGERDMVAVAERRWRDGEKGR